MTRFNSYNSRSSMSLRPMDNDRLRAAAPSIFATEPWHKMSSKYMFVPTITIVENMRDNGFVPVSATQSRTRIEGKSEFTKHMIRFRDIRSGENPVAPHLGQLFTELVLTNAHDGAAAYILDAGLFRLACLNGLMVCDKNIEAIRVTHRGGGVNTSDQIIEASYTVAAEFPKVLDSVEQFNALQLTAPQREAFAEAALELRYDADEPKPVTPRQLLAPRRTEDAKPNLWSTFNVVQENVLNGGIRQQTDPADRNARRLRTRAVSGISEASRLNKALWTLTQKMQELVTA